MISFEEYFNWINNEVFKENFSRDKEIVFNYLLRKTKDSKLIFNNINQKFENKENIYENITKILLKKIKKDIDIFANLVLIEKIENLSYLEINKIDNDVIKEIINILTDCYTYLSI